MELLTPELVNGKSLDSIPEQTEVLEPSQPHWERFQCNEEPSKQLQWRKEREREKESGRVMA